MGKKILLVLLGLIVILVALVVFVLVPNMKSSPVMDKDPNAVSQLLNTAAYAMVSDLTTEADYQKIWEEASENMAKQKSFEVEMEISSEYEEGTATMKVDGQDFSMFFNVIEDGEEMEMNLVRKGEYSYFGSKGEGVKTKADSQAAVSWQEEFDVDEFKDSVVTEEWDSEDIEYRGLEVVGGKKYYTYYSDSEELTTWIDALAILPVKFEGDDTYGVITYGSVKVEASDNYEDISNLPTEEQEMKILEIFFSGMEDDWMLDDDWDDWDLEEDWMLDEDWDDWDLEEDWMLDEDWE